MTIYIQNNTTNDIKFNFKGEVFLFPTGDIVSLDETFLPYSNLERAYGYKALYHIEQPTVNQINSSTPALQVYFTGLSQEEEDIIKRSYGADGSSNALRKLCLLWKQTAVDAGLGNNSSPILAGASGSGNATLTVPTSTKFVIQNSGSDPLSFTISSITISLAPLSSFEDSFNPFTSIDIVTTSTYNWYSK